MPRIKVVKTTGEVITGKISFTEYISVKAKKHSTTASRIYLPVSYSDSWVIVIKDVDKNKYMLDESKRESTEVIKDEQLK